MVLKLENDFFNVLYCGLIVKSFFWMRLEMNILKGVVNFIFKKFVWIIINISLLVCLLFDINIECIFRKRMLYVWLEYLVYY